MPNLKLWEQFKEWKTSCKWVDLSHELSPDTPHWVGFSPLGVEKLIDLDSGIFRTYSYTTAGQYGTHVDAPNHMVDKGRGLDQISLDEMIMPLCIIDKSDAVRENADYSLLKEDIEAWESEYGKIPVGAFVVFKSDWSKRPANQMDNLDADGNRHFPGWSMEAVEFLVEQRNIGGIGHETSDTEAPVLTCVTNYEVELYILAQDRIQVELLTNLDQCPPVGAIIFCAFPKVKGGTGFPTRCFALCPRE